MRTVVPQRQMSVVGRPNAVEPPVTLYMAAPTSQNSIVVSADMRQMGDFPQLHWDRTVKLEPLVDTRAGYVLMWGYAGSIMGGADLKR